MQTAFLPCKGAPLAEILEKSLYSVYKGIQEGHTCELLFTLVVSTDSGPVRNSSSSFCSSSSTVGFVGAVAMAPPQRSALLWPKPFTRGPAAPVFSADTHSCKTICFPDVLDLE